MKTKLVGFVSAGALACALAAAPAFATVMSGSMTWNFYSLGGSPSSNTTLGTSQTFNQGVQSLTATSVTCLSTCNSSTTMDWTFGSDDLVIKNGGSPGEDGLGMNNDPYNGGNTDEIVNPNGIELSGFSGHIWNLMIGSVQTGETWAVVGWDTSTSSWNTLGSGMGAGTSGNCLGSACTVSFDIANYSSYSNIILWNDSSMKSTYGSNDIILESVTTVPEPGTLALLSFGLAAVGFAVSRRRKVSTAA